MYKGKLITWKDDRGFGFIQPNCGEKKVFLHISNLENKRQRPKEGDIINYQLTTDEKGKPCARNASIHQPLPAWLLVLLLLLILPVWGSIKLSMMNSYFFPIVIYPLTSLITYCFYAHDKKRATGGGWRVSEKTLHFCELIGGWSGAFIAQNTLNHKSKKSSYQLVFWAIVTLHLAVWAGWLFLNYEK
jgi:uncharacterized membrane protein YsdA (DUF1294 family)/cold shock CspA family protein